MALAVGLVGCASTSTSTLASPAGSKPGVAKPTAWVTTTASLDSGGRARTYVVARPAQVTAQRLPVLLFLHGRDVTPEQELQRDGFEAVVGRAILVYPAGFGQSWNAGACCGVAQAQGVDDVAYLTAVVQRVLATQPDSAPGQVYLAGYSNGGKMAYRLSCADPRLFAAVAVYAATETSACAPRPVVSFLLVASTADPDLTMGPGGAPQAAAGFVEPTVTAETAAYRRADGCGAASGHQVVVGSVGVTTWSACQAGTRVAQVLYPGGNHAWPGGGGATPAGAALIWTWMRGGSA
ncbi:MAG: alpha/beta hydrolase family esterase [Acidimicrobiales bacterium]